MLRPPALACAAAAANPNAANAALAAAASATATAAAALGAITHAAAVSMALGREVAGRVYVCSRVVCRVVVHESTVRTPYTRTVCTYD